MFYCNNCPTDKPMRFDFTDYYDFDIYICENCGHELWFPADGYDDPDSYLEGEDDYDFDDGGAWSMEGFD